MVRILSGAIRLGRAIGSFGAKVWSLGNPVQTALTDTFSQDAGDDYLPWANNYPLQMDKYGNAFCVFLRWNGGNKRPIFAWRNVGDANWTDNPVLSLNDGGVGELALNQVMLAYDSANDIIHALWNGQSTATGILYRRYVFIRDGSHNITGIDWDYTDGTNNTTKQNTRTNLQIDFNAVSYTTMQLLWLSDAAYGQYGALLAVWDAEGTGGTELRASMCVFGATAQQGKTAANWANLGLTTTNSAFGCTISVAYNAIVSRSGSGANLLPVVARKQAGTHANDLYLAYSDAPSGSYQWRYTRLIWNGTSHNWPTQTTAAIICSLNRSGTDAGYSQKYQLMSGWAESAVDDAMYVTFPTWKDNTSGDTWSFIKVDNADVITLVDVASAGGGAAWFFAPAGSIAYDAARGLLVAAYPRATDGHALVQLYRDTTPQGSTVVASSASMDIAALSRGATVGGAIGNKVALIFRNATVPPTPPYQGYIVTLDWQ